MPKERSTKKQLIRELTILRRKVKSLQAALERAKSQHASPSPGCAGNTDSAHAGAGRGATDCPEVAAIKQRLSTLSPRQREVLGHVVAGRLNKQTAKILSITEGTVKVHRGCVMRKMRVESLAELVRDTQKAGINHFAQAPLKQGARVVERRGTWPLGGGISGGKRRYGSKRA